MAIFDDGHRALTEPELVWSGSSCRVAGSAVTGGVQADDVFKIYYNQRVGILVVADPAKYSHGTATGAGKWARYQLHWSSNSSEFMINWVEHAKYDCYARQLIQRIYRLNRR